jgi:hypothetical protein
MENFFKQIIGYISSNPALLFPWLGFVLVMSVISEIVEQTLINVRADKPVLGFIYPRRLQALLPILLGLVLGLAWKVAGTYPASCMYFATAGVVSLFTFDTIKNWLASKGWDIVIPGLQEDLQKAQDVRTAESAVKDAANVAKGSLDTAADKAGDKVEVAADKAGVKIEAATEKAKEVVDAAAEKAKALMSKKD